MNAFVLYFALPCMLFRFGMNTPILQLLNPAVIGIYLLCALLLISLTVWLTRRGPVDLKDAAFGAQVAAAPNSGFIGVPLLVALLGAAAAGPVISTVLVDVIVTSSFCIALAQWRQAPGHSRWAAALGALRGAMSNPMPWAILLGAVGSVGGLRLAGPVDAILGMLANAAAPVALVTIGALLWHTGRRADSRTPPSRYLPVALIKLFVHPLLIALVGKAAQAIGVPVSDFELTVLTLTAALPSASNVTLLAERYGADNGRITRIIMASTSLSFLSFSGLAWALRG